MPAAMLPPDLGAGAMCVHAPLRIRRGCARPGQQRQPRRSRSGGTTVPNTDMYACVMKFLVQREPGRACMAMQLSGGFRCSP